MQTNKDAELISLVLFDPQTGKTEMVESDPLGKVDFGGALFSESTDELVETWYFADRVKTHYKDKAYGADVHLDGQPIPGQAVSLGSPPQDERLCLAATLSD